MLQFCQFLLLGVQFLQDNMQLLRIIPSFLRDSHGSNG